MSYPRLARPSSLRRRRLATIAVAAAVATVTVGAMTGSAQAEKPSAASGTDIYIVQVAGAPVASYAGDVAGFAATTPAPDAKLDAFSPAANAYRGHLRAKHDSVLSRVGVGTDRKIYDYDTVFNGFAAKLTQAEAAKMARQPGVLQVTKNEMLRLDTISTPSFLGLDGAGGTWAKQFGDPSKAGLGVIIGVVDTGVWPENPSFATLPEPRPDARAIARKWRGSCDNGTEQPVVCNNKLIGARFYDGTGIAEQNPGEFTSARDHNGHGSHTTSTAGGNHGVNVVINGQPVGTASGIAPAARVAMYKACWNVGANGSCPTVDTVAAINDAVRDGVDVINYSISGSTTLVNNPVETAFFNAAAAGVFVSASAGNSGPGASTVAHNSPWVTTVAASTHDRSSTKTATLGNGATYTGPGVGPAVPSSPLIDSVNAGLAGANPTEVELCFPGTLDPAKVTGKIVICQRGVIARVDKSLAVRQAGGVGMIMYNPTPSSLNADFHFVPSIHVDHVAGPAIKAYAATAGAGATAALSAGVPVSVRAPDMAAFSSRGPALAGGGDLLKPDITGPGVDVIAAVAPPGNNGANFNALSGTSMSSPHTAGTAALVLSRHPNWSPMWVKSALMTTASQKDNTGQPIQALGVNGTPLNFGSGHLNPGPAFDPGLVYDSRPSDWAAFACGLGQHLILNGRHGPFDACDKVQPIDASDLNYASIAVGDLPGAQTVTRKVTNVTSRAALYEAQVEAPAGFTVQVSPSRIVVPAHGTATFTVTITRTTATLGTYAFGALTWVEKRLLGHNGNHAVRSPIAVRPVALAARPEIAGTGASGSSAQALKTGYTGTLTATAHGLTASNVSTVHLVGTDENFNTGAPATNPAVAKVTVSVPAGSKLARFAMFDADHPAGSDHDIFVYRAGTTTLVGLSAGGTSEESVTLTAAGDYDIYVVQFSLPAGVTEMDAKHHSFVVGAGGGSLTATPASQSVTIGGSASVTLSWSGLAAGARYLGLVEYGDGSATIGRTIVGVTG